MATARLFMEKLLFPGWTPGQRRRHMRFLGLGIVLGLVMSGAFGAILYFLNDQGRL
jgi:hypothetical protein